MPATNALNADSAINVAVGMFALGAFVGAFVTYGFSLITNYAEWKKAIGTILSSALGGTAAVFIGDHFKEPSAVAGYCVGLLVALMWAYIPSAIEKVRSANLNLVVLGWLHVLAATTVTILGAFIYAMPALVVTYRSLKL